MRIYINSFCREDNINGYIKPMFTTDQKPIDYNGFEIFKHSNIEFHIVKEDVCVGMVGSYDSAKKRIDTNKPALNLSYATKP